MPGFTTGQPCTVCNTPGARICARCRSSNYCSKECQFDDWPVHKLLCASFSRFSVWSRPSKTHVRGIYFPQDGPKPEVVWVKCRWKHDKDEGAQWQTPDLKPFIGQDSMATSSQVQTDVLLQRHLTDMINIFFRDTFLVDGSSPNKAVEAILSTLPGPAHDWRGPIVAVGKNGQGMDPPDCRDLDMNDFRYICDHFISYGRWSLNLQDPRGISAQQVVKGVRINCLGDRKVFGRPLYEPIDISPIDDIFSAQWQDTSDIADRIELPVLTRQLPPNLRWTRKAEQHDFGHESPYNNQDATFLHLCCDPTADGYPSGPGWGFAGWQWQNDVGSIIVVRRDRKPLVPMHVEAICSYCRYEVRPLLGHSRGEYAPAEPLARESVLEMICRPTFSIYWSKLLDRKRQEGDDVSVPIPYEV